MISSQPRADFQYSTWAPKFSPDASNDSIGTKISLFIIIHTCLVFGFSTINTYFPVGQFSAFFLFFSPLWICGSISFDIIIRNCALRVKIAYRLEISFKSVEWTAHILLSKTGTRVICLFFTLWLYAKFKKKLHPKRKSFSNSGTKKLINLFWGM